MTDQNAKCQKPENLKGGPQGCSPEQVRKCHGAGKTHPCVRKAVRRESDR